MAEENSKEATPEESVPADAGSEAKAESPEAKESEPTTIPAPPLAEGVHYIWGTGRRKTAVARVRMRPGTGNMEINKRPLEEYFTEDKDRLSALSPLKAAQMVKSWDVWVNVRGGGFTGQAGAVKLGLARALVKVIPELHATLKDQGLMTRDSRISERKKYGKKGARKSFQWTKR